MATKSSKPIVRIHDTETDEVIDREMTDDEYAERQARIDAITAAEQTAIETKAAAEAKLATLGLTADDLKALLG